MINDCLIIGAGQAGLCLASLLMQKNRTVLILERDNRVGDVWRRRPDSMKLFTIRKMSQLPGLYLTGDPKGYPDKNEIADYLENYAKHHGLNILTEKNVYSVEYNNLIYTVKTQDGQEYQAYCLVNATGANQEVNVANFATNIPSETTQLTINQYKNPTQFPINKKIAIIGDGASGRQAAKELAETHNVTLFCGSPRPFIPQELLGINTLLLLKKLFILSADTNSMIGRWLIRRGLIPCNNITNKVLSKKGVKLNAKLISNSTNGELISERDETVKPDIIIWSLGYKEDTSWLTIPYAVKSGKFICHNGHKNGGKTPYPDLFIVGRKWLSCRASELIIGSIKDTQIVANFIETALNEKLKKKA